MSKYEDAIKLKAVNEQLIESFERQIRTESRCYTGLAWRFEGCVANEHERSPFSTSRSASPKSMNFSTDMFHGYHDTSTVCSDGSNQAGREIAKTLDELKALIIPRTITRLQKEIKEAALAAKEEAKAILAAAEEQCNAKDTLQAQDT